MRLFRFCSVWLLLLPFAVAFLHSQTTVPGTPATIKSNVRAVLVDVVVIDSKDEPIPGLHQEDFQVLENGQQQKVLYFEEHKEAAPTQVKLPPMPPGVFTNFPTIKTSDAVNVLLLDWLNTQPQDQPYVRAQITKYLQSVKPGTPLAIFALESRLHMVQGFSADPSGLLAVLKDPKSGAATQASRLLPTAVQKAADKDMIDTMIMMQAAPAAIDAARQEMEESAASHTDDRVKITLQALQQLARYLASIPGRKNVIWFSGSFPVSIFPGSKVFPRKYQDDLRQTADLLTPSQVAIYPVSATGLAGDAKYDASFPQGPPVREDNAARAANQTAMDELAIDTGGISFYNTNGLGEAVSHVIKSGTRYYTLTYAPTDDKMDGTYRNIQVKLRSGKYKLSYRRGYYSEYTETVTVATTAAAQHPPEDPLLPLMGRGLPDFAQVLYKVRVLPSSPQPAPDAPLEGNNTNLKRPLTRYGLDFAISAGDLKLDAAPDGTHQDRIELMIIAYDGDGQLLNWVIRKPRISLPPKVYDSVKQIGLQIREEIDVPAGGLYLRTGIYDVGSNKAGTLGIPLTVTTAPK